jgi:hypothetical protein
MPRKKKKVVKKTLEGEAPLLPAINGPAEPPEFTAREARNHIISACKRKDYDSVANMIDLRQSTTDENLQFSIDRTLMEYQYPKIKGSMIAIGGGDERELNITITNFGDDVTI